MDIGCTWLLGGNHEFLSVFSTELTDGLISVLSCRLAWCSNQTPEGLSCFKSWTDRSCQSLRAASKQEMPRHKQSEHV